MRAVVLMIAIGLTLNVITPAHVKPFSKLPVVVVCAIGIVYCHRR